MNAPNPHYDPFFDEEDFDDDRAVHDAHADADEFDDGPPYNSCDEDDEVDCEGTGCGRYDFDDDDRSMFQDPGGNSALRRATRSNPRNLPCPTCHRPNMLTRADSALGYQCDICADLAEGCY